MESDPVMQPSNENAQKVLDLLQHANQHENAGAHAAAMNKLKELEGVVGFKTNLFNLVHTSAIPADSRLMAAIILKNSVKNNWKRAGLSVTVRDEEQTHLKASILTNLHTLDQRLAKQLAVIVGDMAKKEWPMRWPSLLPDLSTLIQSADVTMMERGLHTLHQILKLLSEKRLISSRKNFEEAATQLLSYFRQQWHERMTRLCQALEFCTNPTAGAQGPTEQEVTQLALHALLFLKPLHRLISIGVSDPSSSEDCCQFFPQALQAISFCIPLLATSDEPSSSSFMIAGDTDLFKHVHKLCRVIFKTVIDSQQTNPLPFRVFLSPFTLFFSQQLTQAHNEQNQLSHERLTVQALLFLSRVVSCRQYKSGNKGLAFSVSGGLQFDSQAQAETENVLAQLFTPQNVAQLVHICVTRLNIYSIEHLEQWQEDPEEFLSNERLIRADEKVRPAASSLLQFLLEYSPSVMGTLVLNMLQSVVGNMGPILSPPTSSEQSLLIPPRAPASAEETLLFAPPVNDYQAILFKDSVYMTLGLASQSPELLQAMEANQYGFAQWYTQLLCQELATPSNHIASRVLRRRVVWLIGEYSEHIPDHLRPTLYQALVKQLADQDKVVRYTCVTTLRRLLDSPRFMNDAVTALVPFLDPIVSALFNLTNDLETLDCRIEVLSTLRLITETLGQAIGPCIHIFVRFCPALWQRCLDNNQSILRSCIVGMLTCLVTTLQAQSSDLHSFVVPVLEGCLADTQTGTLHEEAFDLWQELLCHATSLSPPLQALFPLWLPMAQQFPEKITRLLGILESYLLLGGKDLLQAHAPAIQASLTAILQITSNEGASMVAAVVETVAQVHPLSFLAMFGDLFTLFILTIVGKTGPGVVARSDLVLAKYLTVFHRLMFQVPLPQMQQVLVSISQGQGQELMVKLLDISTESFDCIAQTFQRKTSVLAMFHMLRGSDAKMLLYMPAILTCYTSVLSDLGADDGQPVDFSTEETAQRTEVFRRQMLALEDPLNKIVLRQFVSGELNRLQNALGAKQFEGVMSQVDPLVLQML